MVSCCVRWRRGGSAHVAESVQLRRFLQPLPDRSSRQEEPVPGEHGARGLAALAATAAAPSPYSQGHVWRQRRPDGTAAQSRNGS